MAAIAYTKATKRLATRQIAIGCCVYGGDRFYAAPDGTAWVRRSGLLALVHTEGRDGAVCLKLHDDGCLAPDCRCIRRISSVAFTEEGYVELRDTQGDTTVFTRSGEVVEGQI